MPKRPKHDLPVIKACFYAPRTWLFRNDKRDERSIDLVFQSLSNTLSEWFQPVLSLWQYQESEDRTPPDLVFISQRDLAEFKEQCGDSFANANKVIICAATGKDGAQDQERIRRAAIVADALMIGAVLPSKLWKVVIGYFPHVVPPDASEPSSSNALQQIEGADEQSEPSAFDPSKEADDECNEEDKPLVEASSRSGSETSQNLSKPSDKLEESRERREEPPDSHLREGETSQADLAVPSSAEDDVTSESVESQSITNADVRSSRTVPLL